MPAPQRDHPESRSSYSRAEIVRSLRYQIERDGGRFLKINLKKGTMHYLDVNGTKHVDLIQYT